MARKVTDDEFVAAWKRVGGSPIKVQRATGLTASAVFQRRRWLAKRKDIVLPTASAIDNRKGQNGFGQPGWQVTIEPYQRRQEFTVRDGYVVIFSDCHYWPEQFCPVPLAHTALLSVLSKLQPKLIVANGDVFDGASISRHDPMGWQKLPTVVEELEAVKKRLAEIIKAAPKAKRAFTVGNHDSRFDRRLASETAEFKDVEGFRISHHFRDWPMSYSVLVNEDTDPLFALHNIKGGWSAPRNNAIATGCTVVTGHQHSQKEIPFRSLLKDMSGVDAGCIMDEDGPQAAYMMDRPSDHRSGFAVVRFDKDGYQYPPELCRVHRFGKKARAVFRGEIVA